MKRILLAILLSVLLAFPAKSQSSKELKDWYNSFNTSFFDSKLPRNVFINRRVSNDNLAITHNVGDTFVITFSTSFQLGDIYSQAVLLHEMCHVATWDEVRKGQEHGPQWRVCMFKLKYAGAFDYLLIEAY